MVSLLISCKEQQVDPRKTYNYHVFLRPQDGGREFYAASTVGLGSCSIIGRRVLKERFAKELQGKKANIICCWRTKGSDCQEEHRYEYKNVPYDEWKNDPKYHIKPKRKRYFK